MKYKILNKQPKYKQIRKFQYDNTNSEMESYRLKNYETYNYKFFKHNVEITDKQDIKKFIDTINSMSYSYQEDLFPEISGQTKYICYIKRNLTNNIIEKHIIQTSTDTAY